MPNIPLHPSELTHRNGEFGQSRTKGGAPVIIYSHTLQIQGDWYHVAQYHGVNAYIMDLQTGVIILQYIHPKPKRNQVCTPRERAWCTTNADENFSRKGYTS